MCRVITPFFRRQSWELLETIQCQWEFCKYLSLSRGRYIRLSEMSSRQENPCKIFEGKKDMYKGVIVSSNELSGCASFYRTLEESLKYWKENDIRTVWFNITLEQSDFIPALAKNGFKFHHTKENEVTMYKWLPDAEECNIPTYSHTMVGVGAVVINSSGELLVLKERFSIRPQWKLPGGYVEPGENIGDAAVREVREETHVQTEFQYLASFRHMHKANFGCSDIYFIAVLKPLSDDIKKCSKEIKSCIWMKVEDFLQHPQVHDGNKFFVKKCLEYQLDGKSIGCIQSIHPSINRAQCVYSIMSINETPVYILNHGK